MIGPLAILAFFALTAGFLGPWTFDFLAPVFAGQVPAHHDDPLLESFAVFAGLGGIVTAALIYLTGKDRLEFAKEMLMPVYELLYRKYFIDEIYDLLLVKPTRAIGKFLVERGEKDGIDFAVDQVGRKVHEVSSGISAWQSGNVRVYALNMVAGIIVILVFVIFL